MVIGIELWDWGFDNLFVSELPDALALIRPIGRHGGLPYFYGHGGLPERRRVGHRADRYYGGRGGLPFNVSSPL